MAWQPLSVCPSHGIVVVAIDTDNEMGILLSRTHGAWAWARSSTLETRLRYTPSSVFNTFPWPDPLTKRDRNAVAAACRRLLARRGEICLSEQIGLTTLYNAVDDGAWADLAALHCELDEAVVRCYGWPASVAQDDVELVRRLSALNHEIADGRAYAPFAD